VISRSLETHVTDALECNAKSLGCQPQPVISHVVGMTGQYVW